jgi:hypothetical protein
MPDDAPNHLFHIGAGQDNGGWLGFNFKGTIVSVRAFDKALERQDIDAFAQGHSLSEKPAMAWPDR